MSRTYIITGSASGIGKATADILREQGHRIIGVDLRGADVDADLGTVEGRATAAQSVREASNGSIDAIIASAGISAPSPATVSVNYFGVTELLTALRPDLTQSEAPRAAVVSSMSSLQPQHPDLTAALLDGDEARARSIAEKLAQDPRTGSLIYASSKRAISRWVRAQSITADWAGAGIPLNAVGPGVVTTPMTTELLAGEAQKRMLDYVVPMPLNHHQPPETIAHLLIWLTSVENTHCAGQTIYCDGGADVTLRGEDAWSWADQRVGEYFAAMPR